MNELAQDAVSRVRRLAVRNPRTGGTDYEIVATDRHAIASTCARLRDAQPAWAARSVEERAAVLIAWVDRLIESGDAIAQAEAIDTGTVPGRPSVAQMAAGSIRGWCAAAPAIFAAADVSGQSSIMPHVRFSAQLAPYQLVGAITPWNMPLMMSLIDAVPALLAGSAVIVKPSELTPRFIAPIQETIARTPELAEVFAYMAGDSETGQAIVDHADMICFTGSVAVGRQIAARAAERMVPAGLEMGGKDPAIVAEGADIDHAAARILHGATWNNGQLCFSIERVYVATAIHAAFLEALVRRAKDLGIAYPDATTGLGPFISATQARIVEGQIQDAIANGARLLSGGEIQQLGGGLYLAPTVLADVTHAMQIMREETFGPVIPVMAFDDIESAVRLANDSEFGLSAAVFAASAAAAAAIGRRLHAGTVSVQDTCLNLARSRDIASDGYNASGLGASRSGPGAITRFLRTTALLVPYPAPSAGA